MQERIMERCPTILAKKGEIYVGEDKISKLPDEVLVSILSRLTMKEAARTSVVAHRWLKVWTFCPSLNFDDSQTFLSLYGESRSPSEEQKQGYVNRVNSVLEAYQGSTIDDFQVHFDLDAKYKCDIDRWVNFVFQKGVKRLVIDFGLYYVGGMRENNVYPFPLSCNNSALWRTQTLHLLSVLKLKYVDVSGAVVEYFISACPFLEKLTIEGSTSQDLVHLNVQSHCLKKVKLYHCWQMKSICLSTTTLLSFKFYGSTIDICYANVPNLVEVFLGGSFPELAIAYFPRLSNCLSRLERLTIYVPVLPEEDMDEDGEPPEFPVLTKLKILKLRVSADNFDSLLVFDSLMKAVPSLDRLVVQFSNWWAAPFRRRAQKVPKSPLRCLKVAELVGFWGRIPELEFATYLIKNAVMLEKIIIDPIPYHRVGLQFDTDDERLKKIQASKKCAMRLRSKFSLGNKLVLRNF
ncbi:F-box/LRR-repeat protein At3g58900-like [Tripterygium wilfordii]|uniref:F-box/LRR-repeat protein At3g58900-like n=1 Tax=Tripterygium wilfordii TaxID=458696 RepID=UPI0018F7F898|nr:F-box/LRR-repeat protein At3g58900-like [Tripterygium wilfordii]